MIRLIRDCPFCGKPGTLISNQGSYGYTSPTVYVQCSSGLTRTPFDRHPVDCIARTISVETETYNGNGRGYTQHRDRSIVKVVDLWNRRA